MNAYADDEASVGHAGEMGVQVGRPFHPFVAAEADDGFRDLPNLILKCTEHPGHGRYRGIRTRNGWSNESGHEIGRIHELGKGKFVAIEAPQKFEVRLGDVVGSSAVALCNDTCRGKLPVDDSCFCLYRFCPLAHWTILSMPFICLGSRPLVLAVLFPMY